MRLTLWLGSALKARFTLRLGFTLRVELTLTLLTVGLTLHYELALPLGLKPRFVLTFIMIQTMELNANKSMQVKWKKKWASSKNIQNN